MKRFFSVVLSLAMLTSVFAIDASAAFVSDNSEKPVIVQDIYSVYKASILSISSSGYATCRSLFSDNNSNISYIRIDQTLQKKSFGLFWAVSGGSWSTNNSYWAPHSEKPTIDI